MTEPPREPDDYDGHRAFRGIIIGTIVSVPMWAVILWLIFR
jgi:hypothetical protein